MGINNLDGNTNDNYSFNNYNFECVHKHNYSLNIKTLFYLTLGSSASNSEAVNESLLLSSELESPPSM